MLRGQVNTMSVADVLEWADRRHVSGTFVFERGAVTRRLGVTDGAAVLVSSSHPAEHLGRFLVGAGYITDEALEGVTVPGHPLGRILVTRGLIAEGDLRAVLESKISEAVYEMLSWDDGGFAFEPDIMPERGEVQVRVSLRTLLADGEGRARLWRALRERIPSDETRFKVRAYSGTGDEVIQDVARGLSVREIMLERRWLPFQTYRALAELAERGAIAIMPTADPGSPDQLAETVRALLSRTTVPRLSRSTQELDQLDLSPAERALVARIDGRWDTMTLIRTLGIGEVEALLGLERLAARGLVSLDG
jgi:hypothetical protein